MKIFLLSAFIAVVVCDPTTPRTTTSHAPELVRCKRDCELLVPCAVGPKLDARGCPTCECLEDPCKATICPEYQECQANKCTTKPCTEVTATCKHMCPMPMCSSNCPFGYKNDENGCMTCTCKEDLCKTTPCPNGKKCVPVAGDCPEGEECDMKTQCVVADDNVKNDKPKAECLMYKCMALDCEFGRARDANGCAHCDCAKDPCEGVKCDFELICEAKDDGKAIVPHCTVKPLCHHQREHMEGMMGHMKKMSPHPMTHRITRSIMHVPQCARNGDFIPRQCHNMTKECWCVDDRGLELDGTRKVGNTEEEKPTCLPKRTSSVNVHMKMKHDMDDIHEHIPHIQKACKHHISKWLMVEEEQIVQIQVLPSGYNIVEMDFVVVTDSEGHTDLASVMYYFTTIRILKARVPYAGHTITPVPESVKTKHEYSPEPELPANGGVRDKPKSLRCFTRDHGLELIVALLGVTFFFLILTTFCCLRYKKKPLKPEHMQTFKENLAFSNNLYDKANLTLGYGDFDDEKKIPLDMDENKEVVA